MDKHEQRQHYLTLTDSFTVKYPVPSYVYVFLYDIAYAHKTFNILFIC